MPPFLLLRKLRRKNYRRSLKGRQQKSALSALPPQLTGGEGRVLGFYCSETKYPKQQLQTTNIYYLPAAVGQWARPAVSRRGRIRFPSPCGHWQPSVPPWLLVGERTQDRSTVFYDLISRVTCCHFRSHRTAWEEATQERDFRLVG